MNRMWQSKLNKPANNGTGRNRGQKPANTRANKQNGNSVNWDEFISHIDTGLGRKTDKNQAKRLLSQIKPLSNRKQIANIICQSPCSAIDNYVCNQLIRKFQWQFNLCRKIFNAINDNDCADVVTFNSFIDAAGKNNQFKDACNAFNDAKQRGLADLVTFASFIDAAGKNNQFKDACNAFNDAKQRGLADVVTFNSFIDAAGKNNQFKVALDAFIDAKQRRLADVVTFASFIDAAGKNNQFKVALDAFNDAKQRGLANVVTFNSFIDAAGKNNQFKVALDAFNDAKQRGLANVVTFNSFIDAAGKNNQFKDALDAFNDAKQRGLANVVTFNSFIAACLISNKIDSAVATFRKGLTDSTVFAHTMKKNHSLFDLHGLTYASAYIALYHIVSHTNPQAVSLQFITGQGHHSQSEILYVRKAVEDFCKNYGIQHHYDAGRVTCDISQAKLTFPLDFIRCDVETIIQNSNNIDYAAMHYASSETMPFKNARPQSQCSALLFDREQHGGDNTNAVGQPQTSPSLVPAPIDDTAKPKGAWGRPLQFK